MPDDPLTPLMRRAAEWLYRRCELVGQIVADRRGYPEFVAYVFRLRRPGRSSVWYVVDRWNESVRRFKEPQR